MGDKYIIHAVNLSASQVKKIEMAAKKGGGTCIRLSKNNLKGPHKLPLTQTQVNKLNKATGGVNLKLSESQLKYIKNGGFLPLLALIPIIASAIGATGALAGGVTSAVNSSKANAEQMRHNRAIEEQLKNGAGIVSDTVGKIPVIGKLLAPLLQKIGLGVKDINKFQKHGCTCLGKGIYLAVKGNGLYLGPKENIGSGLFLGPNQ